MAKPKIFEEFSLSERVGILGIVAGTLVSKTTLGLALCEAGALALIYSQNRQMSG